MRLVIGIGNVDCGDDGAGRAVARRLSRHPWEHLDVVEMSGEAPGLVEAMENAEDVAIIDAARTGAPPGTVHRIDMSVYELPSRLSEISSHGASLATAIELARALDCLPDRCVVYVIEGRSFDFGAPLSPEVEAAVEEVALRILRPD